MGSKTRSAVFKPINILYHGGLKTMYQDKTLVCRDCGNEFVFTAG
ncbi:MAG: zinc-ribbon domain containing protein, partial [Clostridia bacterium]|nr:zinc-ribbon domain containing protein [Clostridia bacterium]